MSAVMSRALGDSLKAAAGPAPAAPRELDVTTLGQIRHWLTLARQDVQTATLHARGNQEARATLIAAGQAVRAALDVFDAAYARGKL